MILKGDVRGYEFGGDVAPEVLAMGGGSRTTAELVVTNVAPSIVIDKADHGQW